MAKLDYHKKQIWYTRPFNQTDEIKEAFVGKGAKVSHIPLIELVVSNDPKVNTDMANLNEKSWVLIASPTAAQFFFQKLKEIKSKPVFKIACVGLKTASLVEKLGHKVSFVPKEENMYTMCRELPFNKGDEIYYFGVSLKGNEENFETLVQRGADLKSSKLYHNKSLHLVKENTVKLNKNRPDYIVLTSYSCVDALVKAQKQLKWSVLSCPIICIGPLTSRYAQNRGFEQIYTAESPSPQGFINAQ